MKINLCIIFLIPILAWGQKTPIHKDYDWQKNPIKYELSEDEKSKDEIVVFEKRSVEFFNDGTGLKEYFLTHRIKVLNTDKAIEQNNTLNVTKDFSSKFNKLKARVVKPSGEIIEVSEDNIKETKDEDGNIINHYFAFEGLVIGSYIEFFQYTEGNPDLTGSRLLIQSSVDKKNVEIDVIYPKYLEFEFLSKNGLPDLIKDENDTAHVRMYTKIDKLPGLEDEDWSAYQANLQKLYYKLDRNKSTGKGNFYTYTEVSKLIHQDMFATLSKKEKKLVLEFIEKNTKGILGTKDRIRALEDAMKTTIPVLEGNFEGSTDIGLILTKKITNDKGIVKLMLNCLREMNIPFELVMTSDRTEEPFDEEFQAYLFLQTYMIYVKELDQYFASGLFTRIGFPPYEFTETKGLFISELIINDFATSVAKVKYIKGLSYEKSIDQIDTELTFNEDLTSCNVNLTRINSGYKAMNNQPILDFLDDEQKKELKEEYLKYLDEDAILENVNFENDHSNDYGIKPLIGKATLKSQIFVERAGDKILLKAGLLIGPQAQMYHKKERKTPVDSYFCRGYERKIIINIPENYVVKNLDDLIFNCAPDTKNNILGFTSSYVIDGNRVIVTVKEWYNTHFFSVEDYPMYEKTMNAAADFNKVVLVFELKQ